MELPNTLYITLKCRVPDWCYSAIIKHVESAAKPGTIVYRTDVEDWIAESVAKLAGSTTLERPKDQPKKHAEKKPA